MTKIHVQTFKELYEFAYPELRLLFRGVVILLVKFITVMW